MKLFLIFLITFFTEANQQYAEQNYAEAAVLYEQAIAEEPSAEAYYNLGNAYFKSGELGKSILNYERALRLRPSYDDAKNNLRFAQSRIIDNIDDKSMFFLRQWAISFRNLLTEGTWSIISVACFLLCLVGLLFFALSRNIGLKKTGFHTGWALLLCAIIALACAASLHHRDTTRKDAIVMQGIVNAKSSPDKSGTDLFVLHEGTKVVIEETVGEWCEIHVGTNIGWVRLSILERI